VRVVASRATLADAGVAWLFQSVARCVGAGTQSASTEGVRRKRA
jgi:hypothetical protein